MRNEILRPIAGGSPEQEQLSREQLTALTETVLNEYGVRSVAILHDMVRRGEGRQVLGSVPGRPEDEQLQIDTAGENILVNIARSHNNFPYNIMGEHNHYTPMHQIWEIFRNRPHVALPIDSFDNSSQYKRGLDTPPYTAVGAYHSDKQPIGSIVGSIKEKILYIGLGGKVFMKDLDTEEVKEMRKSERTTIKDNNATIATYLGSNEYSILFFDHFRKLIEDMPPKGLLYAGGGAYIYALLAKGSVDAYVMFHEPRTEIDPGLPLALMAGCTAVSVNPDGSSEEYQFDEGRRHDDSVPLFIAACTPELRDEIIKYYVEGQKAA